VNRTRENHLRGKPQNLGHGFPASTDLVSGRNSHGHQSFQGGEWLILFQIGLSRQVEGTHVSLKENHG
jgi:hypothetical protein